VLLEVVTVSVEVTGLVLLIVTADLLKEQLGLGTPPEIVHERVTLPV